MLTKITQYYNLKIICNFKSYVVFVLFCFDFFYLILNRTFVMTSVCFSYKKLIFKFLEKNKILNKNLKKHMILFD